MKLSPTQLDDFYGIGYVILRDVFSRNELDEMKKGIDSLQEMSKGLEGEVMKDGSKFVVQNGLLERVVWAGAAEPILLQYGRDGRLTSIASQFLETTYAEHLINQVHLKLPGGGFYPWHQDSTHRGYGTEVWKDVNEKGSYVQIIVAIDDVDLENGPLFVIPYSSRQGHLHLPYDKDRQTISDAFNPNDAVPVLMESGDTLFFGPYLVHGSEINIANKPRRIFINGYAYPRANKKKYPGEGSGELIKLV